MIIHIETSIKNSNKKNEISQLKRELERKDEENKKAIDELSKENKELKQHLNETALALAEFYEATMANNA